MKKIIVVFITVVMLFNLSIGVFAQSVPGFNQPKGNYFPQLEQAQNATQPLVLATEEQRREQEIVSSLGLNPAEYKKEMEKYAKSNKMDINEIDISASYKSYSKEILRYHNDYLALVKIFNQKTYLEVLTEANSFAEERGNIVSYQGKKYNKVALYHAAIHNLATRTKNGYLYNGVWVFKAGQESDFEVKEKVSVMDFVYKIINLYGYYPKDEEALYQMSYEVVSKGKGFFKSTKVHKDEAHDANGVVAAISILTALSNTSAKKQQSAQVVYNLSKDIMRKELGAVGILSGSEALLTLNTDDSLNKLYTLLAEDLYRGWGTEILMYVVDTFSIEELQQRLAGFTSELNSGLGQYHNAIARRYSYVDPKKNSYDQKRLAEARDESLASYSKVIYTDIFEEIGKMIGNYSNNPKVAQLASRFAAKYYSELSAIKQGTAAPQTNSGNLFTNVPFSSNKARVDSPLKRETKIHASLIVGILSTTKQKNENLTNAARVIYNGNWWDINEITQRDKNNAAAKYLNLQKKQFNQRKQNMYSLTIKSKNMAKFADVFAQAAILGKMVVSMPAIMTKIGGRISNWVSKIKNFKIEMKAAKVSSTTAKPVEVKPTAKPNTVKPTEAKPTEVAPAEVKPVEVKPLEMPNKPATIEPARLPAEVQTPQSPAAAKVRVKIAEGNAPEVAAASTEEMATITRDVKWDILGKYYQRQAAVLFSPLGFLKKVNKRIMAFLTNKPYLSEGKMAKVRTIVDEAAAEVAAEHLPASEAKIATQERALAKIQESADFTASEKFDLTGKKPTAEPITTELNEPANPEVKVSNGKAPANVSPEVVAHQKATKHFKAYKKAYREGKVQEAYDNINEAIRYDDKNAIYYYERAMMEYYNFENYTAAMEDMGKACKLNPKNNRYKHILEDRWGKGIKAREAAKVQAQPEAPKQVAPEEPAPGQAKPKKQQTTAKQTGATQDPKYEARKYFERAKRMSRSYTKSGYLKSLEYYGKAIELDPTNATYYYERALLKRNKLRDLEGGVEDLKQACKYDSNSATYKETLAEWTRQLEGKNATATPEEQARIQEEVRAGQIAEDVAKNTGKANLKAKRQADLAKQQTTNSAQKEAELKMKEADKKRQAEFERQQAQTEREIELQKQEDALKQAKQEEQRLKQEQAAKAEQKRRARLTKEQREAEDFYNMALKNKTLGNKQQAYDYFEQAISKETRKAVKAQYSIEEARFLRYAKGTGKDKIVFRNEKGNNFISYNEAALRSYDRAIEFATTKKVKAQYLLERAEFKRYINDFEGAQADIELANKLDPKL